MARLCLGSGSTGLRWIRSKDRESENGESRDGEEKDVDCGLRVHGHEL